MLSFVGGKFPNKMTKYLTTVKWSHSIDMMSIQIGSENLEWSDTIVHHYLWNYLYTFYRNEN